MLTNDVVSFEQPGPGILGPHANSAGPAQMPQNAASDQGVHCFLTGISMQNTVKVKLFIRNP